MTNHRSSTKNLLTWIASFAGACGTIGGAVGALADIGSPEISVAAGTLAGAILGGFIGASLSRRLDDPSELLEKGEAFDFLYADHHKNPRVANARLVEEALKQIPSFDKNDDGRRWYAKSDLEQFLDTSPREELHPPAALPKTRTKCCKT